MTKKFTFLFFILNYLISWTQQDSVIFPRESSWKYLDNGTDQGTTWRDPVFVDLTWSSGNAELGYGDVQTTTVSYGPNASSKYATTYFRASFNLTNMPVATDKLILRLKRDDGAIVYINGTEVYRVNMPTGLVNYQTFANSTVDGANELTFFEDEISASNLQIGNNLIAVEIHQSNGSSSDISFDLELSLVKPEVLIAPIDCSQNLDSTHISKFISVMPSAQPDSLRIPDTHTFQMLVNSGDPYTNASHGETKGLFDFTGYVPKSGSSHNGYLSINHEQASYPAAGVSMLDIAFDSISHIWNVTNNQPVDFTSVQGTARNCSGTVTPWNTIITAEESTSSLDANEDGFNDLGWLVEIDPATATVVDYNTDGRPDKLFRMGNMSHENVVISADNRTAYYGNDQNPGYVFKFIADEEKNMSQGELYVLKLDGPLDATTTGSWIGIPNYTPEDCNSITSFAASVGGTNFDSVEDVEISPKDGKIYFTSKASSRVYRFKDLGNTVSNVQVYVGNTNNKYVIETESGLVEEQWGGGVDNLTFDDAGNLYVIQDGGRNHIYMVPFCHTEINPAVKLFAVTPAGSEPTGMTFSPDFRYMFVSIQHPNAVNSTLQTDAAGIPVAFNKESAIVIARKEFLGPTALPFDNNNGAGVNELMGKIKTVIYPNPTNGMVKVQINSTVPSAAVVKVYDVLGTTVRLISKSIQAGDNTLEINLQNLPSGVYPVTIYTNGEVINTKVVKQ